MRDAQGPPPHDFNNILQVIMGNLEIARFKLQLAERGDSASASPEGVVKTIETAQRASRSAGQLVQRMLVFSRMQRLEPASLDVNALISDMQDMIARTLGETIDVKASLAPALSPVFADRNQLESALLNLVVKRPRRDAGRRIAHDRDGERRACRPIRRGCGARPVRDDQRLDTGGGIPQELMDKVFEPFFTTKEVGTGSGLGLSMVYGFVKQSRGHVRLHSEVGAGTSVRIHLPRFVSTDAGEGATATAEAESPPTESSRAREGETVLLVEDNEHVRTLGVSALENLGYQVLEGAHGPSALRLLEGGATCVDLLFTDVVLPGGMSGPELGAASSARRPGLPVLFTSGYTGKAGGKDDPLRSDARMLRKPYALETLAGAIRLAIDRAGSRRSA